MSALISSVFTLSDATELSRAVIFHPRAGANRVAVAEDIVHAADVRPEFVFQQALRRKRRLEFAGKFKIILASLTCSG